MKKLLIAVAACTMVAGSVPALAAGRGAADTNQAAAAGTADAQRSDAKRKKRTYCVDVEGVTGSRLTERICGTKEKLKAMGVEIAES